MNAPHHPATPRPKPPYHYLYPYNYYQSPPLYMLLTTITCNHPHATHTHFHSKILPKSHDLGDSLTSKTWPLLCNFRKRLHVIWAHSTDQCKGLIFWRTKEHTVKVLTFNHKLYKLAYCTGVNIIQALGHW